jgi:hypothetical protein
MTMSMFEPSPLDCFCGAQGVVVVDDHLKGQDVVGGGFVVSGTAVDVYCASVTIVSTSPTQEQDTMQPAMSITRLYPGHVRDESGHFCSGALQQILFGFDEKTSFNPSSVQGCAQVKFSPQPLLAIAEQTTSRFSQQLSPIPPLVVKRQSSITALDLDTSQLSSCVEYIDESSVSVPRFPKKTALPWRGLKGDRST